MTAGLFTGCGAEKNGTNTSNQTKKTSGNVAEFEGAVMKTELSQTEYTLYQNIFYNKQKSDYENKETTKVGTFATLYDAFNKVERYYVWGYMDNTKCCDWQWELKLDEKDEKPANGSYVQVKGKYQSSDDALDKFWIVDPKITVLEKYEDRGYDVDMCAMSDTLLYVEIQNIVNIPDYFEGKTVCGYGRIQSDSAIEDAYYDEKWSVEFETDDAIPAFGTVVVFTGTIEKTGSDDANVRSSGFLKNVKLYQNTQY